MSGVKPSLQSKLTGSGLQDRRATTCKICGLGIFEGELRQWSRRPLGLIHTECAPTAGGAA